MTVVKQMARLAVVVVFLIATAGAQTLDSVSQESPIAADSKPVPLEKASNSSAQQDKPNVPKTPLEFYSDAPASQEMLMQRASSASANVVRGPYVSIQVNVNALGNNIVGDAANEPSIAIDPTNPNLMAIGWRQFGSISSNFRQAGIGYSTDGGQTWTFPGPLDPAQFRSDPILGSDADGIFYYSSLSSLSSIEVFRSFDGGATWGLPVSAFGGDKQWIAVDRTVSAGAFFQIWNVQFSCCTPYDLTRSTDQGVTFDGPFAVDLPSMKWGTMDIAHDGKLYFAGSRLDQSGHLVARSSDARNAGTTPTYDFVNGIDLGGTTNFSAGPNPGGLLGQVWVKTDHSGGPTHGNVYILASVDPPGPDPLDVNLIRSTDGGQTWSAPVRVNDDPIGNGAWQWFGSMAVAPNGRIDVVFNDTRTSGQDNLSELFYTYSSDAGMTWAPNIPVSPMFDSFLGWPQQNKLGDYYEVISDAGGANVAWAATFNGEQDVYFTRIAIDCNDNGVEDPVDIAMGTSPDCNDNNVPDECEPDEDCNTNSTQDICDIADLTSPDCNGNQVPDECESAADCNDNGTLDICELATGAGQDCNDNSLLDECDIDAGGSFDDNGNGVPDECQGACCSCAGCTDATVGECFVRQGTFHGLSVLCQDIACQPLTNGECAQSMVLPSSVGQVVPFDNRCAPTDGPTPVACDAGAQAFGADIWYDFESPCSGDMTVSLCDGTSFDTILAVYEGIGSTCICPTDDTRIVGCGDDTCGSGGGPSIVSLPVLKENCYTIRVAGWSGAVGTGELDVSVACVGCSPSLEPEADVITAKNRYLSFNIRDMGRSHAIRVTFVTLPPPHDALNGTVLWVGDPEIVSENGGSVPPVGGYPNFAGATLQCDPQFVDWNALGTVHVSHSSIVPGGTYLIEVVDGGCEIDVEANFSGPLEVTLSAWGDLVGPFDPGSQSWGPPDASADVVTDVIAILAKFSNEVGAPIKARVDMVPETPDRIIDITDALGALDAFQGFPYPYPVFVPPCAP